MTRLGCSGSLGGIEREDVAFEHNNMLEIVGERRAAGKPAMPAPTTTACRPISVEAMGVPSSLCRR